MKIVVFTGAGVSRESGLLTFRDTDGLWNGYSIEEVATIEGWFKDQAKVLDFYNRRRAEVREAVPNLAHKALADLERHHDVTIVTQNIDDLHERAGSTKIIHLHGEIFKARSSENGDIVIPWRNDIEQGDLASDGSPLRPNVVWFGEGILDFDEAVYHSSEADIFIVVGTTLAVYPAAGLVDITNAKEIHIVDPAPTRRNGRQGEYRVWEMPATEGIPMLVEELVIRTAGTSKV